jgi:hypothetical protein
MPFKKLVFWRYRDRGVAVGGQRNAEEGFASVPDDEDAGGRDADVRAYH